MTIVLKLMVMLVAAVLASGAGAQADPNKVLRVVFRIAETGFDPPAVSDLYSNFVNRVLFDTPFRFDFPARPHKFVPNTAIALPQPRLWKKAIRGHWRSRKASSTISTCRPISCRM